jgi:hypothetical protein
MANSHSSGLAQEVPYNLHQGPKLCIARVVRLKPPRRSQRPAYGSKLAGAHCWLAGLYPLRRALSHDPWRPNEIKIEESVRQRHQDRKAAKIDLTARTRRSDIRGASLSKCGGFSVPINLHCLPVLTRVLSDSLSPLSGRKRPARRIRLRFRNTGV